MADAAKRQDENRIPAVSAPKPQPEAIWLLHPEFAAECTLSIIADGKNPMYRLNRRQVFGLMAQCAEVLKNMEPGR